MGKTYFNIGVYLAALIVLADQFSKSMFLASALDPSPFYRLTPFLNLRLNWNRGVTFGLLNNFGAWMPTLLVVAALLITLLLLRWLAQVKTMYAAIGLGAVIGGAIGNVIDRARFGAVVDFIDLHYGGYHWYTFNLADSAICIGVGLLLLENVMVKRHKR